MNLIKIACVMLAIALFLGILTSGNEGKPSTVSAEAGKGNIASDANGRTETLQSEEKVSKGSDSFKSAPESPILEKGESKMSKERERIENKVNDTVKLIEAQGEGVFPSLKGGGSQLSQDGISIFIWTADGTQVVCPSDPSSEGKDMSGLEDTYGKPIGKFFIEIAEGEKGEGWIEYRWQEKGSSEPFHKCTFVKKASFGRDSYIVGADLYLDNYIVCRDIRECKYAGAEGNLQMAELLNSKKLDKKPDHNYSIYHSVVEPGKNTESHLMKSPEVYYILEGEGFLYIDGVPLELRPDKLMYIPADSIQAVYNTGKTDLKFLIINPSVLSEQK
ncbi:MAG TPA: cache domain-containing protein [Methanosarcina sp.]|nr:cache domain-containing protein [Methanosarcina sp.]